MFVQLLSVCFPMGSKFKTQKCVQFPSKELEVNPAKKNNEVHDAFSSSQCFPKEHGRFIPLVRNFASGATAQIDIALDASTGHKVAVKRVMRKRNSEIDILQEEAIHTELSQYQHPNLAKLITTEQRSDSVLFFIEYAEGKDLIDQLVPDVGMPTNKALYYAAQLFAALDFIHKKGFAHRDVKGENCVLTKDLSVLKLIDFGYAVRLSDKGAVERATGTLPYIAPELLANYCTDLALADCFSAGVVLFSLLTGRFPWGKAASSDHEYMLFTQGEHSPRETITWKALPAGVVCLLKDLLTPCPHNRLNAAQAYQRISLMLQSRGAPNSL